MIPKAAISPCCGLEMEPVYTPNLWGPELLGFRCPNKKCNKLYTPEQNQAFRGIELTL